jgi:hypothetical protein
VTPEHPWDGRAAQVAPLAVERLPLLHWRPGTRLLAVGSRDGASFSADWRAAEERTYQRPLAAAALREAAAKLGTSGYAATWAESLRHPLGLAIVREAAGDAELVVATAGRGDATVLDELLPRVDAWLLLVGAEVGDQAPRILADGRHVEVLIGLDGRPLPDLALGRVAAVHLVPRATAADPRERLEWYAAARARLPGVRVYDEHVTHSDCACGERLVWRAGGVSRLDGLLPDGTCRVCGRDGGFVLASGRPR